jgi:hypothetical protein
VEILPMLGSLMPVWARWAVLLAAAVAIYGTGRVHQAHVDEAEQLERDHRRMVANVDRLVRRAAVASAAGSAFEADRTVIETRTRIIRQEVQHVVERPVYRDCRLDPDGLRLVNAALGGSAAAIPASQPPEPVPSALPDR